MRRVLKCFLFVILFLLLLSGCYFFVGNAPRAENISWGVNFSQKHTENLGLDWKETYLAILDDLGARNIKIAVHWDFIEGEEGKYYFDDLDWQIREAEKRGVKVVPVIGMKTSRWPECHLPQWAKGLEKEKQQEKILGLLGEMVARYGENPSVSYWQVENEPLFPFGECPWVDKDFLKKEIKLVKSLDTLRRPVIVSDSGEGSFWIQAARFGDVVGTTMYRKVWMSQFSRYADYPFPPVFYWRKAQIIQKIFNKNVICIELQAEPWGPSLLYDLPLEEQQKTMNADLFRKNIDFARKTGFNEFYLWGSEWWYWMKEKQNNPEMWDEAKKVFKE